MPIYEYTCRSCSHQFELLVLKSTALECPNCKATDLERLLSLPAVKSETTKDKALRSAKKRDQKQGAEREYTQREYEKHHDD